MSKQKTPQVDKQLSELERNKLFRELINSNIESEIISDSYIESYKYFISYFKGLKKIQYTHAVIGAHAVYGWMPTVLNCNEGRPSSEREQGKIVEILEAAKLSTPLEEKDLETLKTWINNSIVGASKLLHFINPEIYPIWDSNINRVVFGATSGYKTNDVNRYLEYKEIITGWSENIELKAKKEKSDRLKGAEISNIRYVEALLFYTSKSSKQRKEI